MPLGPPPTAYVTLRRECESWSGRGGKGARCRHIQTKNNGDQIPLQFIVTAEVVGDRRAPSTHNTLWSEPQGSPFHSYAKPQAALGSHPLPTLDTLCLDSYQS